VRDLVEPCRCLAGLIDVVCRSRFIAFAIVWIVGCGGAQRERAITPEPSRPAEARSAPPRAPDPDLHRPPPRRLLDIDWEKIALTDDAAAIALWRRIAPTGADWEDKVQEIPAAAARPLAIAVLHGGNFTCARPPTGACPAPIYDVDPPADTAGLDEPCLRRLLALWAIDKLDDRDLSAIRPALHAIAAIPPPESQLVAAALHAIPEDDHDARLAILAIAWRAGQRDLVDAAVGALDEAHLITAVRQHHIAGALDVLSAEGHRAVYLAAINDDALPPRARTMAIGELVAGVDALAPDLLSALASAAKAKDCSVAAAAAHALDRRGDRRFAPRRPRTASIAQLMRAMCVLASFEVLQPSDAASLLPTYVPPRGLERVTISYDALSDVDSDGDGDPHTTQSAELVPRDDAVLPQVEDLARAMQHCTGAICVSDDHEYRLVWRPFGGELMLSRIEIADRPPCKDRKAKP
jgi:hypothetical protein